MTVRRIKSKQRRKCSWCAENATHRGFMFGKSACGEHLSELTVWDRWAQAPDYDAL